MRFATRNCVHRVQYRRDNTLGTFPVTCKLPKFSSIFRGGGEPDAYTPKGMLAVFSKAISFESAEGLLR